MKKFGTRFLGLLAKGYLCRGGPLAGSTVFLTEYSRNTAYIEWKGHVGHYIYHKHKHKQSVLRWEPVSYRELERLE